VRWAKAQRKGRKPDPTATRDGTSRVKRAISARSNTK
jgi:hypothetical protein